MDFWTGEHPESRKMDNTNKMGSIAFLISTPGINKSDIPY
jgi:hypothetical protein